MNRSIGASRSKLIGRGSKGGLESCSAAGSTVIVVEKAISMPRPAISPSSESPRKPVGKNEKKAHAVAAAASAKGMPAFFDALRNATWRSLLL